MEIIKIEKTDIAIGLLKAALESNPDANLGWMAGSMACVMSEPGYEVEATDVVAVAVMVDLVERLGPSRKASELLDEANAWIARRN